MKKFMRPCAIFLSVVMFLNMMDLGVFAETVQKVMDESNNPYYIADEDKIYDEELSSNQRIIAENAQFTGIAAGRGVGFTTGLLLLREGLGMRETPIRPHSWH